VRKYTQSNIRSRSLTSKRELSRRRRRKSASLDYRSLGLGHLCAKLQFEITITLNLRPTHKVLPPFPPILGWKSAGSCVPSPHLEFSRQSCIRYREVNADSSPFHTRSLTQRIGQGVIWVCEHGDSSSRSTGHRKHRDIADGNVRVPVPLLFKPKIPRGQTSRQSALLYRDLCSSPVSPSAYR
jgi:hypothetical protein